VTRTGNEKYVTERHRGPLRPEPEVPDYAALFEGRSGMGGMRPQDVDDLAEKIYRY
jgi:hypothetical protein